MHSPRCPERVYDNGKKRVSEQFSNRTSGRGPSLRRGLHKDIADQSGVARGRFNAGEFRCPFACFSRDRGCCGLCLCE